MKCYFCGHTQTNEPTNYYEGVGIQLNDHRWFCTTYCYSAYSGEDDKEYDNYKDIQHLYFNHKDFDIEC